MACRSGSLFRHRRDAHHRWCLRRLTASEYHTVAVYAPATVLEAVHARKHLQAPGSIVDFNAKTTANKFRIKMLHRFANVA